MYLLAGFTNALIAWSPARNANKAIRAFRSFVELGYRNRFPKVLRLSNAGTTISRRLCNSEAPCCDAELFEDFVRMQIIWISPKRHRSSQAALQLYHPTEPTAGQYYDLVMAEDEHLGEHLFVKTRSTAQAALAHLFLRAAYILRHGGEEEKAAQLEAIVERHCEGIWHKRGESQRKLDRDPKLDRIRSRSQRSGEDQLDL